MTLRSKTLLIGGVTLIALIGVFYAVSARFLLAGFALIEKQETTEGVERVRQDLNNVMLRLDGNISGWGQWDDSVQFVRSNNPSIHNQYIAQNLNEGILAQFKSDLVLYLGKNGQLIFGTGFNRQLRKKEALPVDVLPYLRNHHALLRHPNPQTSVRGIILLEKGPMLVASRPIVNNAGTGPIHGSLICGRFLNSTEINNISQTVQLPVVVQRFEQSRLPEEYQNAQAHLTSSSAVYTNAIDENNIAGYARLNDVDGRPALILRVETKRDIYQQGLISLRFVLVALLTIGLIGGGLSLWALEHWVLARLSRLSQSVEQIGTSGDISVRVPVAGRDELSKLSGNVNRLLETADNAQNKLRVEIVERQNVEQALRQSRDELENRVEERTQQYVHANTQLQDELVERQRAEETLRQAQEMLQLVINHIPQAIFWKDRNLCFLGCNHKFAHNAGYCSPEELVGLNDFDISGENADAYRADDMEVIESDLAKLNIEEPLRKLDGSLRWIRTNKIPLHDSRGMVVGLLGSYEDITPQKLAEEQVHQARETADKANAAKSEFLSRMSHELRTPLNAILGFGQILESHQLSPLQQESISYILKGGRHLLGLINEVLDIARVESGHSELVMEEVLLTDTISEACALMRPIADKHNISINVETLVPAHCSVLADQRRFKQVFINLLSNAVKYNSVNGQVRVTVNRGSHGGVVIAVSDTGAGISHEDMNKLFVPFERLGATYSDVEGTGLGLTLSRHLMIAMGGTLEVESTLGQGSTFFMNLPEAVSSTIVPLQLPAAISEEKELSTRKYIVLCIEDNFSNYRLIELALGSRPDIELLCAKHGRTGLDMACQHVPDLVILDLNLPDMHGHEVLAELQHSELTRDIPVVVISADATRAQVAQMEKAKAFLSKPLNISEFLSVVDRVLKAND